MSRFTFRSLSCAVLVTLAGGFDIHVRAQAASAFEVASIRPSPDGLPTGPAGVQATRSQFRASYLSLRDYIAVAYRMPLHLVSAPEWTASARFEIVATIPEGATPEQQSRMLQALLAERFQLRTHRESRDVAVYTLEKASGFMLVPVPEAQKDEPLTVASTGGPNNISADLGNGATLTFNNGRFDARKVTMAVLAETLSRFVDRPLLDRASANATTCRLR